VSCAPAASTRAQAHERVEERWVSKRVNTTGQAFIGISNSFLRNIRGWPGAEVEEPAKRKHLTPAAIRETFSQFPHGLYIL